MQTALALVGNYWRAMGASQLARGVAVPLQRTGGILLALTGVCLGRFAGALLRYNGS